MKKVFAILAATVLFAGMASAQLGINVGYAPQTYKSTYTSGSTSTSSTTSMNGFFAGANYNINLTGDLGVSLGVNYRMNMGSEETTVLGVTAKDTYNQSLVDVPILFNYGLKLSDALKLSVFAGPTINFALSGKTTSTYTVLGTETTTEADWYGDNTDMQKLDLGATVGVNLQYNGIRFFGGYNLGLLNTYDDDNVTRKGSNWFIGLGYSL